MYKLKSDVPDFQMTDGPFALRKFVAGETYAEIPESEKSRFDEIPEPGAKKSRKEDKA